MKVFVCIETQHNLQFIGRVFSSEESLLKALEEALITSLPNAYSLQEYLTRGYIKYVERDIEGLGNFDVAIKYILNNIIPNVQSSSKDNERSLNALSEYLGTLPIKDD